MNFVHIGGNCCFEAGVWRGRYGPMRVANSTFCFGYFQEAFGLHLAICLGVVGLSDVGRLYLDSVEVHVLITYNYLLSVASNFTST